MTPLGIGLLAVGIIVIIASFFVPDKEDRDDKKDIEKKQEQIRKLMERELDGMKLPVFLGPHPQHLEVPRLGVESEL